jgi:hypothetical protein
LRPQDGQCPEKAGKQTGEGISDRTGWQRRGNADSACLEKQQRFDAVMQESGKTERLLTGQSHRRIESRPRPQSSPCELAPKQGVETV